MSEEKKWGILDVIWAIPGDIVRTIFSKYPPREYLDSLTPRERARVEYLVRKEKEEYEREKQRKKDARKGEGSTLSADDY